MAIVEDMSDDSGRESQWRAERRREAIEYLDRQGVKHCRLGEVPAWQVYHDDRIEVVGIPRPNPMRRQVSRVISR